MNNFNSTHLFSLILVLQSSCSYRLANSELKAPPGVSSIYVEAIYDTASKSLPHDLLWNELQRAVGESGKLRLTSREQADAHLRAHLVSASIIQVDPQTITAVADPVYQPGSEPADYRSFRSLNVASKFAGKEVIQMSIAVDLVSTSSGKAIFSRMYPLSRTYSIINIAGTPNGRFQRADEAFESNFQYASKELSGQIVRDILKR